VSSSSDNSHVVVIGAGPGGYPAAFAAAHRGFRVTMVDENANPGGVCLNVGCIPSKALLHVARVIHEAADVASWGIDYRPPTIDLDKLRAKKNKIVEKLTRGISAMAAAHRVKQVRGRARFLDARTLEITSEGQAKKLEFDHAIIATGSRPAAPKALSLDTDRVMDSTGALELPDIPATLLVVGGGYIGLEMGTVYAALGTRVSVVEMTGGLLPGADRDLADVLTRKLRDTFEDVLLDTRVMEMSGGDAVVNAKLLGPDLKEERAYDRVLVAVGRRPNSGNLGLEKVAAELDDHGFIEVDAQRRTAEPSIFAIGDVAGEPGLAHKATHEARVAVEAIAGEPSAFDPACIPAVVFTDPEVAWCGLSENEALREGIHHKVVGFPWAASGRAASLDRPKGLTKLVIEPRTDRILGVGIVGVGAGDLISEGALAVEMGATVKDLALTIHPHPTMSETVMEAADLYLGHSPHFIERKKR